MEPTTLHERVSAAESTERESVPNPRATAEKGGESTSEKLALTAADPGPSRQGPPAYRPGNPVWDAGWASCQAQAIALGQALARLEAGAVESSLQWQGGVAAFGGAIRAMRPAPPVLPPLPLTEG